MHFTKFATTCILMIMGVSAIAIPQAATASDPQTIISEWNDSIKQPQPHSLTFTTNLQTILSNAKSQADTDGFQRPTLRLHRSHQTRCSRTQSRPKRISRINEKLKNIIALNSQSSAFEAQAQQFVRTLDRIWCFDYLNGILKAWRTAGVENVVPGGLDVCGFDVGKGAFPAPGV
ncbi:hypothetical protein BCON_0317g00040 [Botryotinia convoluta]|uniref:Uncharacterized protein n=1 Tax=Botryotinia convoluta TaxID=54673 RepID=A0A4Z1HBM3_9HELO|nr:hypothetical protein BCON_0317g00040 [Botryotinia convoluta]